MEQLLQWMEIIEDIHQQSKVRHSFKNILVIVLFAILANADTQEEIEDFERSHEEYLRKYLELKNGILSYDTIQCTIGVIRTEQIHKFQLKWQELLNSNEAKLIKRLSVLMGKPSVPISMVKRCKKVSYE